MTTTSIPYFVSPFPALPSTPPIKINGTNSFSSLIPPILRTFSLNEQQSQTQTHSHPHSPNCSIPLPFLTFSNELELTSINEAGLKPFGLDSKVGSNLSWFLTDYKVNNNVNLAVEELKEKLRGQMIKFAKHSKESITRHWDEGLPIDYFITSGSNRFCHQAEVIIQHLTSTSTSGNMTNSSHVGQLNTQPDASTQEEIQQEFLHYGYSILLVKDLSSTERRSRPAKHSRPTSPSPAQLLPTVVHSSNTPIALRPSSSFSNRTNRNSTLSRAPVYSPTTSSSSITQVNNSTVQIVDLGDLPGDDKCGISQSFDGPLKEVTPELCREIVDNLPIVSLPFVPSCSLSVLIENLTFRCAGLLTQKE